MTTMSLRLACSTSHFLRRASSRPVVAGAAHLNRGLHSSRPTKGMNFLTMLILPESDRLPPPLCPASTPPFTEATSPNPAVTKYAEAAEKLHTYGSYLIQCLPKYVQQFSVLKDELTLYVSPTGVVPVLTFLRDHSQCQYKACMDISGVDFPERDQRFEVVYHLLSVKYGSRIRVKTYASEVDSVPSATSVFRGADWYVISISMPCACVR